ncbi:hypothetical protein Tco_0890723 [Tanacetum coccineum]|uniref:Uncharacterized protein n=1 Tax=Tanacetum coccineum TaxID=301880 RepID=A0ABQ5C1B0_9ASTR
MSTPVFAYLGGTDTESEPFEDPIDTKTLESPLAITPPIPLSESTPPILVPILRRTLRMAVCVPLAMSLRLYASMAGVAAMSESALHKRFRSSYESSPSVSPPDLPSQKCYRGMFELVEDSEEDNDEEDEEIEESMDSDNVSDDAEDEGLTTGVEGPGMDDEGYGLDDESRGINDKGHSVESDRFGLEEEEEAVPGGQQQAALVVGTPVSVPLGLGYEALRRHELALEEGDVYGTFEVGQGFRSAPESGRPKRVSAFRQPTLTTWTDPKDAGSSSRDVGGLIRDHAVRLEELPPTLFERSLEYEQERVAGENQDLWLQLAEERRARLELAEVVNGMRRGQEPRGGA